ncbi:hypothetical protein COL26b_002061 [Colletotrichum chrysophilum]|nr:uncharacterized protein COL26b_002061 [Colletotrichum chrysophilum]KAJ0379553.1 hypothetical protein COL26b_002061 [Colletotrichum chrysophilum]
MLGMEAAIIENSLREAQKSLRVVRGFVDTIEALKASNADLKFYIMSNISVIFASGNEGMRKPELGFWRHVLNQIGVRPEQAIMIDDTVENICAARSLGIHGLLVDSKHPNKARNVLHNLLGDPEARAQAFMKSHATNHICVVEGLQDVTIKDNFSQLMIWELTGDSTLVDLRWPGGKLLKDKDCAPGERIFSMNDMANGASPDDIKNNVELGLWNYFCDKPVLTTRDFPPDADTTSTAYVSLPEEYLSRIAPPRLVLDMMAANTDNDGIMQTYFCTERPRKSPEVCCNILRAFNRFGHMLDANLNIEATKAWVVDSLNNDACLDGSRHYSTPEAFLYLVARLYDECRDAQLKQNLEPVKKKLRERINTQVNPLALAMRLFACQKVSISSSLYQKDLKTFMSLQEVDGGWPAGHFCCYGRTGALIGNRGLTTALAICIMQHEKTVDSFGMGN